MAQGPSRRTQWDLNPQPLNTCVSRGAGSTTEPSSTPRGAGSATELSPTPRGAGSTTELSPTPSFLLYSYF